MDNARYLELLRQKESEILKTNNRAFSEAIAGFGNINTQGDEADEASVLQQTRLDGRMSQNDGHLLKAIRAALLRIETGEFGVCIKCGNQISPERLELVPWTDQCSKCKGAGPKNLFGKARTNIEPAANTAAPAVEPKQTRQVQLSGAQVSVYDYLGRANADTITFRWPALPGEED